MEGKQGYDVRDVICGIVDRADFLEVQAGYAPNIVVGFARILGRTIGIIANQPSVLSGAHRHQRVDQVEPVHPLLQRLQHSAGDASWTCRGSCPGVQQEYGGIIRNGAKMLFAYSAATVPKIQIILRKSYGGAHLAMCSKDLGADRVFAWPTAEIAVMGAEGAVEIVFRKEVDAAEDKAASASRADREVPLDVLDPLRRGGPPAGR